MLMVIDIGNTRTKWAEVAEDGSLSAFDMTPNITIAKSALKNRLVQAEKVVIANVAGEAIAQQLIALMPAHVTPCFAKATEEACDVINRYQQPDTLGIDRWAAAIAAWHQYKQPTIVVCAGTAITIDSISINTSLMTTLLKSGNNKKGLYLGGSIMPGLHLIHDALVNHTAKLADASAGTITTFPDNTVDAMQSGCMHAVIGAILLASKQLEKHCAFLPKLIITGGDAVKIAHALAPYQKRVGVEGNLVLNGLALLEKDGI
ncbi:MAG: type III pantothenate kinase [Methylophilaceae bacterium]|nr:MAG: type III pantothenate kinase [Methylophilaceae bacterium]